MSSYEIATRQKKQLSGTLMCVPKKNPLRHTDLHEERENSAQSVKSVDNFIALGALFLEILNGRKNFYKGD
jgi:hypothetical protein